MMLMALFGLMTAVFMCFLPFYWLPVICVVLGYMCKMKWQDTFKFAMVATALTIAMACYLDFTSQNLITKRIGGILQVPASFIPLLPGFLVAWIGVFFSQLGASIHFIYKK